MISNLLITIGVILIILGLGAKLLEMKIIKFPFLPGDILIKRENFIFYFPITSSIVISVIVSLILWLIFRK